MTIYNISPDKLIAKTSEELKKIESIKAPDWAKFVKTGNHKERPPVDKDWWYIRAASMLRKINLLGPVGVSKLRNKYGGKKSRGSRQEEFRRASGSIIRKILQQLEKAELVEQTKKGAHHGRVLTGKGHSLLNKVSKEIQNVKQ